MKDREAGTGMPRVSKSRGGWGAGRGGGRGVVWLKA